MICTCDACHYTFQVESLPSYCPDCGKQAINRRVGTKAFSLPAVREATKDEVTWYTRVQQELKTEDEQAAIEAASTDQRRNRIASVDKYNLPDQEHNWATVLAFVFGSTDWSMLRKRIISGGDPEWIERIYMDARREFSRSISDDRGKLKKQGRHEPLTGVYDLSADGELQLQSDLDDYGPALAVLYRFRTPEKFLHTPTLGDLRKIDLRAIANNPSAKYIQFLMDWE